MAPRRQPHYRGNTALKNATPRLAATLYYRGNAPLSPTSLPATAGPFPLPRSLNPEGLPAQT